LGKTETASNGKIQTSPSVPPHSGRRGREISGVHSPPFLNECAHSLLCQAPAASRPDDRPRVTVHPTWSEAAASAPGAGPLRAAARSSQPQEDRVSQPRRQMGGDPCAVEHPSWLPSSPSAELPKPRMALMEPMTQCGMIWRLRVRPLANQGCTRVSAGNSGGSLS
jgi:hypothetical protein